MDKLIVIMPGEISERLRSMVLYSLEGYEYDVVKNCNQISEMKSRRILFVVELGVSGINVELYRILEKIAINDKIFENSIGSILINSNSELYSKDVARKIIFYANMAGCIFPGRPLSEATATLRSYNSYKKICDKDFMDICLHDCRKVVEKLIKFNLEIIKKPNILTIHSSNLKTSNTLALWNMVKKHLEGYSIREIHIENGSVIDCMGCVYTACKHYAEQSTCFYGDVMVSNVYPAILDCNILIMLCPNYNDSIGANLSAVINRLTALYRKTKFYDKYFYAIIVSGHSGSDIVAQQLISALNINKTFILPKRFALMETANEAGDILNIDNIENDAEKFANNIKTYVK